MMELRLTLPARSNIGIVDMPIEISYDTICALERRPPSSAYLLFEDQPARTIPYTPSDVIARMNRNPIGRSATTMSILPHRVGHGAPKGMTHHAVSAGMNESIGARTKSGLFTPSGIVSSFMKFLRPSANGWSHPLPTLLGPVSYTHLRAHETRHDLVCRLLL